MNFTVNPSNIFVSDDCSGKYPTLFGPDGRKLIFQDDGSYFDDSERRYRWVFRCSTPPVEGSRFVFATSNKDVVACVDSAGILQIVDQPSGVVRNVHGAPLAIEGSPKPKVTIMIVTRNRREILEKTLYYLYQTSDDSERDIFIWDNASTDDTPDFLGTMVGWPGVRVFRSKVGQGVAGPRMRMLPLVSTPYIFSLDDDVWMLGKGWPSAVARVLDGDPSIHQLVIGSEVHSTSNYGTAHEILATPFFRIPHMVTREPGAEMDMSVQHGPPGTSTIKVNGETILVPDGKQLPFSATGGAAAWRTADIATLAGREQRHIICDLREAWGFPLMEKNGTREALLYRYGIFHPCPGAIWHLGHGEGYWADRVRHSQEIYNRAAEEQARWLEVTRAAVGWGRPLDDPDEVLK